MSLLLYNTTKSQSAAGFEQFNYVASSRSVAPSIVVPRVYYRNPGNWYGEIRYNYDEVNTVSLFAGRVFSKQDSLSWSFIPVAGLLEGKLKGLATGLNIAVDYRKLSFSSTLQYTFSRINRSDNFMYSWSELGYQVTGRFYAGLVLQETCLYNTNNKWDPGLHTGFLMDKWIFPVYAFSPLGKNRHFVIGITREWVWTKSH